MAASQQLDANRGRRHDLEGSDTEAGKAFCGVEERKRPRQECEDRLCGNEVHRVPDRQARRAAIGNRCGIGSAAAGESAGNRD